MLVSIMSAGQLEACSDYAGFIGSCIGIVPLLRSSWVYVASRFTLWRAQKCPGSVSDVQQRIAVGAIEKAAHFTLLDVGCLTIGFAFLIVSFLLKILAK